jgi:hypothetical protein
MPIVIIMGAITWMAASLFLDLVDNILATLLTCHSLDLNANDPDNLTGEGLHGPPTFHDKQDRHKKKQKEIKE